MLTSLRSAGLLEVLSGMPVGPSVARFVSTPICAAWLRNLLRKAGQSSFDRLLLPDNLMDAAFYQKVYLSMERQAFWASMLSRHNSG